MLANSVGVAEREGRADVREQNQGPLHSEKIFAISDDAARAQAELGMLRGEVIEALRLKRNLILNLGLATEAESDAQTPFVTGVGFQAPMGNFVESSAAPFAILLKEMNLPFSYFTTELGWRESGLQTNRPLVTIYGVVPREKISSSPVLGPGPFTGRLTSGGFHLSYLSRIEILAASSNEVLDAHRRELLALFEVPLLPKLLGS